MPSGIPFIVSNEAAERFSYYGMKAILTVFMAKYLLMSESKATIWIHSFTMAAYLLPIAGAFIADIWLGKYRTIMALSIFYCLGHGVLAIWETQTGLAFGLGLIAIGSGGIKPNVSSHVGDQFTRSNSHLMERVFSYFYLSINVGSFIATLLIPVLLNTYGPSVAFGLPGLMMLIATWIFWLGRHRFIAIPAKGWQQYSKEVFTAETGRIVLKLLSVYVFIAVFWSLYDQTMSTWVLQATRTLMDKSFNLGFVQFEALPEQIQAVNPLLILILTPVFSFLVYPLMGRFMKVTPMRKIAIGLFITGLSFLVIAWLEGQLEAGNQMHISWQLLAYLIITAGEVMVSITALEFSYTQAPIAIKSFIMALFWATIFAGNLITVVVNQAILQETEIVHTETGTQTWLQVPDAAAQNNVIEDGLKMGLEGVEGVQMIQGTDTLALSGTFLISDLDDSKGRLQILDINRQPVHTIGNQTQPVTANVNILKGTTYYYFFVVLMLTAAVLFLFVAYNYKEEHFIHDDVPDEEAQAEAIELK